MKVITMESSAYKEMMAQIANIAGYIHLKPGFSSEALEMMTEWIKEGELGR